MNVRTPKTKARRRPGFTLVEMMTVIVIIGILAGLTIGAGIAVRAAVKRGIVISDMKQLEMGLQRYESEVGEYPPDFAFCAETSTRGAEARARVVNHLRKRFPKMRLTGTTDVQFASFLTACGLTVGSASNQLNPSTALTFWLGGMLDGDGKPKGFSEDPTNPFKVGEPRTNPYYDFNTERMDALQLMQPGIRPPAPFVYFRAVKSNTTGNFEYGAANETSGEFEPFSYGSTPNVCVPYLEDAYDLNPVLPVHATDPTIRIRTWRAPDTYQIIAAGLDGVFSTSTPTAPQAFRFSKVGENFTDGDYDNLASFAAGELEDEL